MKAPVFPFIPWLGFGFEKKKEEEETKNLGDEGISSH